MRMNKTRTEAAALGLAILLGSLAATSTAFACYSCPEGYVESTRLENFRYAEGVELVEGGEAWSPADQNDPDSLTTIGVQLSGDAWCVAAFTPDFSCYVEISKGAPEPWHETNTCPTSRDNLWYGIFVVYCKQA